MWKESLEKAREFLTVAEMCFEKGYFNSCAGRAYYSIFWAAIAALEYYGHGQETWSHQGLANTFAFELIKKKNIFDKKCSKIISSAYDLRLDADYESFNVSKRKTEEVLRNTKDFLNMVEKRLSI